MKFYSPLTADFFPNEPDYEDEFYDEYEGCPLDGHDLLQYADAVDEAVKKDIADFNGKTGINVSGTSDLAPLDQQAALFAELNIAK